MISYSGKNKKNEKQNDILMKNIAKTICAAALCVAPFTAVVLGGSYGAHDQSMSNVYKAYTTNVPSLCSVSISVNASVTGQTRVYSGDCSNQATANVLAIADNNGQNSQVNQLSVTASTGQNSTGQCSSAYRADSKAFHNLPSGPFYIGHYGSIAHSGYGWVEMTTQVTW